MWLAVSSESPDFVSKLIQVTFSDANFRLSDPRQTTCNEPPYSLIRSALLRLGLPLELIISSLVSSILNFLTRVVSIFTKALFLFFRFAISSPISLFENDVIEFELNSSAANPAVGKLQSVLMLQLSKDKALRSSFLDLDHPTFYLQTRNAL